jgi:hypothetical protein
MSVEVPSPEQTVPWRRNRNWIWVFCVFAALGILAIGINWAWNSTQPLTPERLQEARALWGQRRPNDYDLKIATTYTSGESRTVNKYFVQVRSGRVTGFLVNGREPDPRIRPDGSRNVAEEQSLRESYDIIGLFDAIEELMSKDQLEGRHSFMRARFDKSDGHVMRFERQVDGRKNPYLQVELTRVP